MFMVSAVFVYNNQNSNVSQSNRILRSTPYFKMKKLEDYYTNSTIIKLLCKHRAGISHKRHKKHMSRDISLHNRTNKIIISNKDADFKTIQSLFPTR